MINEPEIADFFSETAKLFNKTGIENVKAGRGRIRRRATGNNAEASSKKYEHSESSATSREDIALRAEILVPDFETTAENKSQNIQGTISNALNPTVRTINNARDLNLRENLHRKNQKKVIDEIYLPAPNRYRSIPSFLEGGEMLARLGEEFEKKINETNVSKVLKNHIVVSAQRTADDELWKVTVRRISDGKEFFEYSRILQVAMGADEVYIEGVREQRSGLFVPIRKAGEMLPRHDFRRSSSVETNEFVDSKEVSSWEKKRILKNLPPTAAEMFNKTIDREPDTSTFFGQFASRE